MRIFSNFHDYYDIGLSYGIDPKCVYNRKTEEIALPEELTKKVRNNDRGLFTNNGKGRSLLKSDIILFCGTAYPYIYMDNVLYPTHSTDINRHIYSYEHFKEICRGFNLHIPKHRYSMSFLAGYENQYDRFFNKEISSELIVEIHKRVKSPVISVKDSTKDAMLRNIEFASVIDPYTAFQELSMFLTNVIGIQENPIVEVSNKTKIDKHGFDKQSFRHPVK
jgi:hypothetical protein